MATLKDVAKDAKVSIATVSCCLSGAKPVKEETRLRVMESIEKLKYIPNSSARNLRATSLKKIGVVLTDIDDLYHAEVFKGISGYLQNHGFTISVAFSNNQADVECEKIDEFVSQNVSGLIIITCQPENTEFFKHRITNYQIPTVFVERLPLAMDVNFVGFDNAKATQFLVEQLLKKGYQRTALITGYPNYSSESDCMQAYTKTLKSAGQSLNNHLICNTSMSKEDAFKVSLTSLCAHSPQAIITTSETIAYGVLEGFHTHGQTVPKDFLLFTFSQENWNHSSKIPGVIHTGRTAYTLGNAAAKLLIKNITAPHLLPTQALIFTDTIINMPINLPSPASLQTKTDPTPNDFSDTLRLLVTDLATSHSAELLADLFTQHTGIKLEFTYASHQNILKEIIADVARGKNRFDIYMYDVPWLPYLVQNSLVADISSYINGEQFDHSALFAENLDNCRYKDNYYGIPMIGGSQIMFYRQDLFQRTDILKRFREHSLLSLRPPRTWIEFNKIAEFFTRKYNPNSPTLFGTSFSGIVEEELAPEILVRLWAAGGSIWDEYNRVCLNTTKNALAFELILETLNYVEKSPAEVSIANTIEDFCNGKTAMLITYTEYAGQISKAMQENTIGQVGYAALPGRTPVSIGWNLGLNLFTDKSELAYQYFSWLSRHDTSYYMTILDGQSPVVAPYHSQELLKLYPWLAFTEQSFSFCRKRTGPHSRNALIIPPNKIESILCKILLKILDDGLSISNALEWGHMEMTILFKYYGYPKPLHFLKSL